MKSSHGKLNSSIGIGPAGRVLVCIGELDYFVCCDWFEPLAREADEIVLKKYFIAHIKENEEIFNFFKTDFDSGNPWPIGKRFEDSSFEQIGDGSGGRTDVGAGRGREGRPGVPEGARAGVEAVREGAEPTGVSGRPEGTRGSFKQQASLNAAPLPEIGLACI